MPSGWPVEKGHNIWAEWLVRLKTDTTNGPKGWPAWRRTQHTGRVVGPPEEDHNTQPEWLARLKKDATDGLPEKWITFNRRKAGDLDQPKKKN